MQKGCALRKVPGGWFCRPMFILRRGVTGVVALIWLISPLSRADAKSNDPC